MNSLIRKLVFGDADIKEYATVTVGEETRERVELNTGGNIIDISQNQWLLCLEPLIFGIWIEKGKVVNGNNNADYQMLFIDKANGDILSDLSLISVDQVDDENGALLLLKLKESRIFHVSSFKAKLLFNKFYKKPKLTFEQLKGFAAAYSYPRRVRIISFRQGEYYNIFPMDLLGSIPGTNKYVFGLRHSNTALSRIIETRQLVVSEVAFAHKEVIYSLGSHHSAGPPPIAQLPFKVVESKNFGFYVPEWADSYKEIDVIKTINLGSHMLLLGEVKDECTLRKSNGNLFHIHYLLYLYYKGKGFAYSPV